MGSFSDFESIDLENRTAEELQDMLNTAYFVLGSTKTHSLQRVKALVGVRRITEAMALMTARRAYRFRRELII